MFDTPPAPALPPPPPHAATTATPSVLAQGQAEAARLASAQGAGFDGTDVTGGKAAPPPTTKTVLG